MFYTRAFEKLMKSSFNSFLAINKYQKHENAVFNSGWVADRSVKRRAIFFECDHWFRFVWFKKPKFLYKSMIWKIVKYTCLVFENRSCFFSCSNRFFLCMPALASIFVISRCTWLCFCSEFPSFSVALQLRRQCEDCDWCLFN